MVIVLFFIISSFIFDLVSKDRFKLYSASILSQRRK